jgi:hypothetical protein
MQPLAALAKFAGERQILMVISSVVFDMNDTACDQYRLLHHIPGCSWQCQPGTSLFSLLVCCAGVAVPSVGSM